MESMPAESLAAVVNGQLCQGDPSATVSNISVDSRHMGNDAVFFALKGTRTDGHRFVAEAFENGARAAVISRSWEGEITLPRDEPVIQVDAPLDALQQLATWWRGRRKKRSAQKKGD